MIKIYGSMRSSAARCFWTLEEVGVAYETQEVNFKEKEHKSDWYMKLNPNGKVPTLVDGEFVLWESCAINDYIAEKYKPELLGSSVEEKALVRQWTYWSLLHVQKYFDVVMYFSMFQWGTEEASEKAKVDVVPFLTVLENHLVGKNFMVGETFTLADVNLATIMNIGMSVKIDFSAFPNIMRWMGTMQARPAMAKILAKIVE
jgi:glutathione S-transferase